MKLFASQTITVSALEFFIQHQESSVQNSTREVIERVKHTGTRVIVVTCYFDSCIHFACEAYKAKLYGPLIHFVFPAAINFVQNDNKSVCDQSHIDTILRGAFYFRQISPDYESAPTELGITGSQLDEYLEENVPGVKNNNFYGARRMCFDNILPAIYIIDNVERQLNKGRRLNCFF